MSSGKALGRGTNVRFGILGTGVVGRTIAARLDGMGLEAMVGTRDPEETTSRTEPDTYGNPHSAFGKRNTPRSGCRVQRSGRTR
jgi:lactate dehydrogenase-like 2-hydroxyacid dehydrogenase